MAGFSDYLEARLLDHVLQGGALPFTPPAQMFVGLNTGDPGDDGIGFEFSGMSYVRKPVTFNATSVGPVANLSTINWTNLPGLDIVWIVVWDALTGGNPLFIGELEEPKLLNNGDSFTINVGDLEISLE